LWAICCYDLLKVYDQSVFKISDNFLEICFPLESDYVDKQDSGVISGVMGGVIDELTERQREVLRLIILNNKITYKELSKQLSIRESAVGKHIEALKEKGAIKREGVTRGKWIVLLDLK